MDLTEAKSSERNLRNLYGRWAQFMEAESWRNGAWRPPDGCVCAIAAGTPYVADCNERAHRHQSGTAMAQVEMYTTMWCPYCARARALLEKKGVAFTEIDIEEQPRRRDEMIRRAGRTSVPQIFIDGEPIGGSDDMAALDRAGKLDTKLGLGA